MGVRWGDAARGFVRGARGAAGLELAIGAPMLLAVAFLVFDLYSRVAGHTSAARAAVVMADYVSRGPDTAGGVLDSEALEKLGSFLHERELGLPADAVFVVTALTRKAKRRPVEVLWTDDTLRFGRRGVTRRLARSCSRFVTTVKARGRRPARTVARLPAGFAVDPGEVVVVVELCARPTRQGFVTGLFVGGDIYRHHVLPVREPAKPFPAPGPAA